jgi:hypothetical protein
LRCDTARPKLHIHFSSGNAFFTTLNQNIVTWMHSFLLIFLWFKYHHVSNSNELWNNTRRYEILHTSNLGCSFNSLRESCNNQRPRCMILHGFMLQIIYTTVFRVKLLNNLMLHVQPFSLENRGINVTHLRYIEWSDGQ